MPVIWCSISAHGFGHAAQVIPVLNALGNIVQNLHVTLRTNVPSFIFEESLQIPWDLQAVPQDVGCLQRGPLDIDIEGTWSAYDAFHENWNQRVAQEVQAMNVIKPNLVISNISYLAIASAFAVKCPVVAVASLSWDQVLHGLMPSMSIKNQVIVEHIQQEYAKTQQLIRLFPGIDMPAFVSCTDTGPSFLLGKSSLESVRTILRIERGETLVLLAFGGVSLTRLPLERMEGYEGFQFLVSGMSLDMAFTRIHRVEDIPLSFGEVMRQVDVVMTKPGYATIMMAVHYYIPLVYVRRYNFVDEQGLVDYVHKYGRALELSREDFESGVWGKSLQAVLSLPAPMVSPPKPEAHLVADLLRDYLKT